MTFTGLIIVCMVGSLAEAQVCVNPDGEKRLRIWTEGMDFAMSHHLAHAPSPSAVVPATHRAVPPPQFSAPAAGGLRRITCGGI